MDEALQHAQPPTSVGQHSMLMADPSMTIPVSTSLGPVDSMLAASGRLGYAYNGGPVMSPYIPLETYMSMMHAPEAQHHHYPSTYVQYMPYSMPQPGYYMPGFVPLPFPAQYGPGAPQGGYPVPQSAPQPPPPIKAPPPLSGTKRDRGPTAETEMTMAEYAAVNAKKTRHSFITPTSDALSYLAAVAGTASPAASLGVATPLGHAPWDPPGGKKAPTKEQVHSAMDHGGQSLTVTSIASANPSILNKRAKGAEGARCSSRFRGVSLARSGHWRVQVGFMRKRLSIGHFPADEEENAARAYDCAVNILHGTGGVLNFPRERIAIDALPPAFAEGVRKALVNAMSIGWKPTPEIAKALSAFHSLGNLSTLQEASDEDLDVADGLLRLEDRSGDPGKSAICQGTNDDSDEETEELTSSRTSGPISRAPPSMADSELVSPISVSIVSEQTEQV